MNEDKPIARLIIYVELTEQRETDIIKWLLDTVDFIKNHDIEMGNKFTTRLFDNGKRIFRIKKEEAKR
jgi:hypothetical protein